ncbi:MAG: YhcH/YjgK/YiaL family protein [Dysgonamonadaceae bacterium]|jgi:YhcH/YjgK/YiaL family protein|nr:YhcH/YjgK/YiaL family protein [Dysgonamonadaceae bacterium]MDD3356698.1 YhcH/YjgK/YiaL family protein [Dysgonamonadaceae bacterium]MDD3727170.1 YhcH/YjgK/YiaL family protein [Dysgonamonadaceae bacterium]MDD4247039.1 YhcH/YjgK/YiaL family protein [Dysgonamonadaceae bacterium]MDD4605356.1 YhcH/YjgK/YiaL family protein [Dysgonamonadaceae bacterium]
MIVDNLNNAELYYDTHPRLKEAFDFLYTINLKSCKEETIKIDGDNIKLIISTNKLKSEKESLLEVHRYHLDIHIPLSQPETFGWKSLSAIEKEVDEYDSEKDIELFNEKPSTYITLQPREFAIFFPDDAHAPLIGAGDLKKIIFKIFID